MAGGVGGGDPAYTRLDVRHHQACRRIEGGGGDGHERSRVGASAVAILAGDELPEGVGVLEVLREHVAHRRRELGHFDDALAVGQLDEPDDEDG